MILTASAHHVRATIAYFMTPSSRMGEGSPGPIIGSGSVRIQSAAGSFVLPLSALDIDRRNWNIFPLAGQPGCGAGAPLTIHQSKTGRNYVIVESIEVGKGCRPQVHVIDVTRRHVVPEIAIDHASLHSGDVPPSSFQPQRRFKMTRVERFPIPASAPANSWFLTILSGDTSELFAENLAASDTPRQGEALVCGSLIDRTFTMPEYAAGNVCRLSAAHERNWQAQQTPAPVTLQRTRQYNMYFNWSDRLAERGRFADALAAYQTALSYLDDERLRASETARIPKLKRLIDDVRTGRVSVAQAKQLWLSL